MKHLNGTCRWSHMPRVPRVVMVFLAVAGVFLAEQRVARPGEAFQTPAQQTRVSIVDEVSRLTPDNPITREFARRQIHNYEFPLAVGQYVHVIVDQYGIDVSLSISDHDQKVIAQVERSNGSRGPEEISMIAPMGGVFRLRVSGGRTSSPKPSYRILMETPKVPSAEDTTRIQAERITFEGEAFYAKSLTAPGKSKTDLLEASIKTYERALKVWQSLAAQYDEALILYSLGWCYSDMGSHDMVKFPLPLYRLRWSYEARGDHQTAITYFREALRIMRSLGDKHGEAIALTGLAWPSLYLGNESDAVNNFSSASHLFEEMGNLDGEARTLYGLGWVLAVLNRNEEAREKFTKALHLRQAANDRRGEAINMASLGRIYGRLGNQQQALMFSERARALFTSKELDDRHGVASTLTTEGWAYFGLKRYPEAIDAFQKALELRDEHDITGRAVALYGMAQVEDQRGNLEEALVRMDKVIKTIDPLRTKGSEEDLRTYYFANVQEYYTFYTELLMRLHKLHPQGNYAEKALWSNERALARELVAILAEALPDSRNDTGLESTKALTAADVARLLDDDSILLEYSLTDKGAYLWTVMPASKRQLATTRGYKLTAATPQIVTAALTLLEMLKEKGGTIQEFETAASSLSTMLIPPKVAAQIRAKRKVIVVADGVLQYVPFVTMSISRRDGAYIPLVASHEVASVPSMSTVAVLRRKIQHRTPAPNSIAVLADPVFKSHDIRVTQRNGSSRVGAEQDSQSPFVVAGGTRLDETELARILATEGVLAGPFLKLKRLDSTREEAETIRSLQSDARLELDFDASLKTVTRGNLDSYRIVHFATHGIALDNHPEASGIFLSMVNEQGEPQDGYLYFQRVCRLRLPVELVVLSGCDTNFGKHVRGEGLIGLTRGFMYAGAPRVVATLWEVRGGATKELMKRFYTSVLTQGMRPSAALSAAQASMWKEQKWTPSDWAAFRFSGEWRQPVSLREAPLAPSGRRK